MKSYFLAAILLTAAPAGASPDLGSLSGSRCGNSRPFPTREEVACQRSEMAVERQWRPSDPPQVPPVPETFFGRIGRLLGLSAGQ